MLRSAEDLLALGIDAVEEDHEDVLDGGAGVAQRVAEVDLAAAVGGQVLDQQHALAGARDGPRSARCGRSPSASCAHIASAASGGRPSRPRTGCPRSRRPTTVSNCSKPTSRSTVARRNRSASGARAGTRSAAGSRCRPGSPSPEVKMKGLSSMKRTASTSSSILAVSSAITLRSGNPAAVMRVQSAVGVYCHPGCDRAAAEISISNRRLSQAACSLRRQAPCVDKFAQICQAFPGIRRFAVASARGVIFGEQRPCPKTATPSPPRPPRPPRPATTGSPTWCGSARPSTASSCARSKAPTATWSRNCSSSPASTRPATCSGKAGRRATARRSSIRRR